MTSSSSAKQYTGGCLCRANRYEITPSRRLEIDVCHCIDCQKSSGSAFAANIRVSSSEFRLTKGGTPDVLGAFHSRNTLSGNEVVRHFCTKCGSPIYGNATGFDEVVVITSGTMDAPSEEWVPKAEHFCKDKRTWMADVKGEGIPRHHASAM
ncbi:hypothetical protein CONPUDRAFT_105019 [Coniophora puteana RWD-64-598 SS2]|uniref:CENP-V/GFA domain-containing protein n=1 Tax=Coniophora puteana (strain RWD-64-598) TaxID=741705 RepID=A0A5M3MQW8_CONPW|nr:uncharacterized protein CONPUDRAFT_105019 [Coniophora puteana RWD-64-598 SS2]EIW81588.1 hypothetical protein CONPUDRAFT_105019 [Coniophora puteana RWD-64-598 SS2]